jgi:HEPN domain-containing protein
MLLEAANLNMPSSFIIKTKRPMSKHSLKRMAAKIIRESYGQRMNSCIVEALETGGSRRNLKQKLKAEFEKGGEMLNDICTSVKRILRQAEKVGAPRVHEAISEYAQTLADNYIMLALYVDKNYGPIFESYSQPKYRRLIEELETDGPRGGVSPSEDVKYCMRHYIDRKWIGRTNISAEIYRLVKKGKINELTNIFGNVVKLAEALGDMDLAMKVDDLIVAQLKSWDKVMATRTSRRKITPFATAEEDYMNDRIDKYFLKPY